MKKKPKKLKNKKIITEEKFKNNPSLSQRTI